MKLDSDDFELFGLPRRQALEPTEIDARWKALQTEVHPDRFVAQGAAARRLAMQWAVRVNEAHRRLKDPLRRAAYLCELRGAPIESETNTAMPPDFLVQQLEWREALASAPSPEAIAVLAKEVRDERRRRLDRVAELLDQSGADADAPFAAASDVRALMFIERFGDDIEHKLEALEGC